MTPDEILRRIRILHHLPKKARPFKFVRLEHESGIRADNIHGMIRDGESPVRGAARLGRALETLEQEYARLEMRTRVRMTLAGPVLDFVGVNAAALPELPEVNKRWKLAK